jgi:transcriptional regulator with XRE-family HTH domain
LTTRKSRPKLSATLIELRRRLGRSQESLARGLHVSLQTVALWETKREPPSKALLQLSYLARRNHHLDLAQIFEETGVRAMHEEERERHQEEVQRWSDIEAALIELKAFATRLTKEKHPLGERMTELASHLNSLTELERDWVLGRISR